MLEYAPDEVFILDTSVALQHFSVLRIGRSEESTESPEREPAIWPKKGNGRHNTRPQCYATILRTNLAIEGETKDQIIGI